MAKCAIKVKAPTAFPMACGNPAALKGFEIHAGSLGPNSKGKMVFFTSDGKGGTRQIPLTDKTGLAGRYISDPMILRTPQGRYVKAHVDPEENSGKGLVMCVSQQIKVLKFNKNINLFS